ncbi:hypothetical protein Ddc_12186 [Ditylenchus destructor]|nr:hypothetical protein Ddc_12186 [Ditylenchus destructor]
MFVISLTCKHLCALIKQKFTLTPYLRLESSKYKHHTDYVRGMKFGKNSIKIMDHPDDYIEFLSSAKFLRFKQTNIYVPSGVKTLNSLSAISHIWTDGKLQFFCPVAVAGGERGCGGRRSRSPQPRGRPIWGGASPSSFNSLSFSHNIPATVEFDSLGQLLSTCRDLELTGSGSLRLLGQLLSGNCEKIQLKNEWAFKPSMTLPLGKIVDFLFCSVESASKASRRVLYIQTRKPMSREQYKTLPELIQKKFLSVTQPSDFRFHWCLKSDYQSWYNTEDSPFATVTQMGKDEHLKIQSTLSNFEIYTLDHEDDDHFNDYFDLK